MINRLQNLKPLICKKHNQPITSFQQDQSLCQICLNEQLGVMSIEQFYQTLEEILLKENQGTEQQLQLLQSLQDQLVFYQTSINKHLEKIVQVIQEQIGIIKTQEQQFQSIIEKSNNQQKLIGELEEELVKMSQSNISFKTLIENLLLDFKLKQNNIDPIIEVLKYNPIQEIHAIDDVVTLPEKVQIQQVGREDQDISNQFEYQLIIENSMKQRYSCFAFTFNRDSNILVVGSYKVIIIYEFSNGKLQKELQRLEGHSTYVYCLYFMKESNCFVSGIDDNSIIIWNHNQNNQYSIKQKLNDHSNKVVCLLMNKKEDLLISGSWDTTIKFWRVQNWSWDCVQTIETKNNNQVNGLKLNEMENKLISCGTSSQILVYEIQNSDQQWVLVQTINTSGNGYRLCFTIQDQFVFQPETKDYLEIYDYDNLKKQFFKLKQVQIQSCKSCVIGFPCQFIRQLNILTVKNGNYLNVFSVSQDGDYQLIQSIEYQNYYFYGIMTDDGQYLITYDQGSKEIQSRNLTQIKGLQLQ